MLRLASQIAGHSDLLATPCDGQGLDLYRALFALCFGGAAMLALVAVQRVVSLFRGRAREQKEQQDKGQ